MDDFRNQGSDQETPENNTSQWEHISYEEDTEKNTVNESLFSEETQSAFYSNIPGNGKNNKNNTGLKVFVVLLCVILTFTILVFAGYVAYKSDFQKDSASANTSESLKQDNSASLQIQETPSTVPDTSQSTIQSDGLPTEDIASKVMPSVVGLEVSYVGENNQVISGGGSGIIMTSDGYIITNAHVVLQENTDIPVDRIDVYLDNGEVFAASIVGADSKTDLAVIKIEKNNLIPAEFGDSTSLRVGEKAIAIGNPTGMILASSLTQGVISGVERNISTTTGSDITYIQTDAAINPGNSGGALVNKYAQVVGINSSKIAQFAYEGIGFAIPIHEAKPIIDDIIANGYVTGRVRIGITFTPITQSMADLMKIPTGLRIVDVDETTDAYEKGVQKGDIITHIDNVPVDNSNDITPILKSKVPGDQVKLTIYRMQGRKAGTLTVDVTLQEDLTGKISQ